MFSSLARRALAKFPALSILSALGLWLAAPAPALATLTISTSIPGEMTIGQPIDLSFDFLLTDVQPPDELDVTVTLIGENVSALITQMTLQASDPGHFVTTFTTPLPAELPLGSYQVELATPYHTVLFPQQSYLQVTGSHDINGDGGLNIADVTAALQYIFDGGSAPLPTVYNADFNCDASVNIADVTTLLGYIFRNQSLPCLKSAGK